MSGAALISCLVAEVATPSLAPASSDSSVARAVTFHCATPNAAIHYTLNGEEPTKSDPVILSGSSITVSRSTVVKAKAWLGVDASPTTTEDYRITGSISCGYSHGLALSVSGKAWSWGEQSSGRLGNGQTGSTIISDPSRVLAGQGFFFNNGASIVAGYDHSLILDQDGLVWAFGENGSGQLGNNSTSDSGYPVRVWKSNSNQDYLGNCTGVDGGQNFSLALLSSGVPVTWGIQSSGRLGNGVNSSSARKYAEPVRNGSDPSFPDLSGIKEIAAGHGHGLAREPHLTEREGELGRVWVWGSNSSGQLGRGDTSSLTRAWPMLLAANLELTDAVGIAGGGAHSAVIRKKATDPTLDSSVWSCGNQSDGRIGNGLTSSGDVTYAAPAIKVDGTILTGVTQVSAGSNHTLALDRNGNVWAWGGNQYGQLGIGTTASSGHAKMVKNASGNGVLDHIVMVSAGGESSNGRSFALSEDGVIWVWGRNDGGQLGNGQTAGTSSLPVAHAQNHVDEGKPLIELTHEISGSEGARAIVLTPLVSHTLEEGWDIAQVKFFVDGELVATDSTDPWSATVANLPDGEHRAYAMVADDEGATAMSNSVTFDFNDLDSDGLPNSWEEQHGLDPDYAGDGSLDPDADGLTNLLEYRNGTDPKDKDTDDDYLLDGAEVLQH